MAKISTIVKNNKRRNLAEKFEGKRAALRKTISDENATPEDRWEANVKLQRMPRDTSRIRVRNRCVLTGRSRGNYRKFRISRIKFRELALEGMLPGVTKSSW